MKDYFWGNITAEEQIEMPLSSKKRDAIPYENSSENDFNLVESTNNRIYYYSMVSRPKILKLNKSIQNLNNHIACRQVTFGGQHPDSIRLHINSYGGSVFAGLSAVDYILASDAPVETIVEGCAASAATLMSVVGKKRFIRKNACMLIHQLSGHMWGKFEEMKDDMKNSEMLMQKIKNIYREHCKIPDDVLENILKHDLWWDAETCLKYGLVDEII